MKFVSIPEIIRLASIGSVALPLISYLVKFRYACKSLHIIGVLAIISAISDFTGYILFSQSLSTVILFNSYYALLFLLLTWFYYEIMMTRVGKNIVVIGLIVFLISFILITLYGQSFLQYQTFVWSIIGMIMIIYSISYFSYLFSAKTHMNNYGLLWINSGVLFYFSFNLFLFVMSSYVLTKLEPEVSLLIWSFHNVNNIIKNALLGLGISSFAVEADLNFQRR